MADNFNNAMQGAAIEYQNTKNEAELTAQEQQEAAYRNNWLAKRDSVSNASNQNMQNYLGASSAYASKGMGGGSAGGLQAQMNAQNQAAMSQASQDMSTANNDAMIAANQYETDLKNDARTDYDTNIGIFGKAEDQRAAAGTFMSELQSMHHGDTADFQQRLLAASTNGTINYVDAENISNMLVNEGWADPGWFAGSRQGLNNIGQSTSKSLGTVAASALTAKGGALLGAKIGSLGGPIGSATGAILGGAIGFLGGWLGSGKVAETSTDLSGKVQVQSFSDLVGLNTPDTPEDYLPDESTDTESTDTESTGTEPTDTESTDTTTSTQASQSVDLSGLQRDTRNNNSLSQLLNQGGF